MARPRTGERPLRRREIAASAIEARIRQRENNAHNTEVLAPAIEAHLESYQAVVGELAYVHAWIADATDLEPVGEERATAVWQVAGRSASLCSALVALLRAGYASEGVPLMRSIHEANLLVTVLAFSDDGSVLADWLSDEKWIRPKRLREVQEEYEQQARAGMLRAGMAPLASTIGPMEELYSDLSEQAHMRQGFLNQLVAEEARIFPIGPHPDSLIRATYVNYCGTAVVETVGLVGAALAHITDPELWADRFAPTLEQLGILRDRIPLHPARLLGEDPNQASV